MAGVTACVAARVHMIESHGLSGIAHMIHMVRLVNGRSGDTIIHLDINNSIYKVYLNKSLMRVYFLLHL
jgi:hypothetical protein